MAEETVTINAAVGILGDVIQAALWPVDVHVRNFVDSNRETVLVWAIAEDNGKFDETNFFQWNTSGTEPAPPKVNRMNDFELRSEPYRNTVPKDSPSVTWVYTIYINKSGQRIGIDPEVDNLPPGGP
ncbi:MAG: hypothetical protein DMF56_19115 [Acidobacteria bacterium]|nr:MAG: hypothetical protein DMF56_19115 [Acidobacteriota bacterium]